MPSLVKDDVPQLEHLDALLRGHRVALVTVVMIPEEPVEHLEETFFNVEPLAGTIKLPAVLRLSRHTLHFVVPFC